MHESIDDLTAPWMGNGVDLATRMLALRDELSARGRGEADYAAGLILEVIRCDYNPLPPVRPQLGDPPRLRPAVPPNSHPGRGQAGAGVMTIDVTRPTQYLILEVLAARYRLAALAVPLDGAAADPRRGRAE
jgi:hypothetical protein